MHQGNSNTGTTGLLPQVPLEEVTARYRRECGIRIQQARKMEDQVRYYLALVKLYRNNVGFAPSKGIRRYLLIYSEHSSFKGDMQKYLGRDYSFEDLLSIGRFDEVPYEELLGHTQFLFESKWKTKLILDSDERIITYEGQQDSREPRNFSRHTLEFAI